MHIVITRPKEDSSYLIEKLIKLGFDLIGTDGTTKYLKKNGIKINKINKISEGSPHIADLLEDNQINLVINTTEGKKSMGDSYVMRRKTLISNTPYYITIKGANVAVNSIEILKNSDLKVRNLQSIYLIIICWFIFIFIYYLKFVINNWRDNG